MNLCSTNSGTVHYIDTPPTAQKAKGKTMRIRIAKKSTTKERPSVTKHKEMMARMQEEERANRPATDAAARAKLDRQLAMVRMMNPDDKGYTGDHGYTKGRLYFPLWLVCSRPKIYMDAKGLLRQGRTIKAPASLSLDEVKVITRSLEKKYGYAA